MRVTTTRPVVAAALTVMAIGVVSCSSKESSTTVERPVCTTAEACIALAQRTFSPPPFDHPDANTMRIVGSPTVWTESLVRLPVFLISANHEAGIQVTKGASIVDQCLPRSRVTVTTATFCQAENGTSVAPSITRSVMRGKNVVTLNGPPAVVDQLSAALGLPRAASAAGT